MILYVYLLSFTAIILHVFDYSDSADRINFLEVFDLEIVTDIDLILCGEKNFESSQNELQSEYWLFATFSAVRKCTGLDRKNWTSLHDKNRIVIMLLPANESSFDTMINYVSNIHGNDTYKWKPFWIFIWPYYINNRNEIPQHQRRLQNVESTLNKCQLNSQVFVVFYFQPPINSGDINCKVYMLEIYGVKNYTAFEKYHPLKETLQFELMNNKAKRRHFHQVPISGVAVDDPKTQLMTEFEEIDGEVRFKAGFAVEAFNYVAESLNFTRKAMKASDHLTGTGNGSVSGLGQLLINRVADILVVNSELLENRITELTFLPSFYSAKLTAFFTQPPASNFRNIYLQPFEAELWGAIIISWIVIIVCLIFISFVKEKMNIILIKERKDEDYEIARDSVLWAVATITQKGWHIHPKAISMKAVFITGLFTAVLTYTAYAAVIISTLSVVRDPIKTMDELENSGMQVVADTLLESSFNAVQIIAMHQGRYSDNKTLKMEVLEAIAGFKAVKPKAIVTTEDLFYTPAKITYSDRYLCQQISKIQVPGPNIQGGMYIRARSPYRENFKHRFLVFRESGVSKRNNLDFKTKSGLKCSTSMENNSHNALGISDVISAYLLLFSAFVCSWLALNFEKIYFWMQIRRMLSLTTQ